MERQLGSGWFFRPIGPGRKAQEVADDIQLKNDVGLARTKTASRAMIAGDRSAGIVFAKCQLTIAIDTGPRYPA
ncbi:MAG: hypothetical protein R3E01_03350 [Pirellulaceae bacterium]|nr:hypothetical protein [Planctomycetales bacterium]